MVTCPACHENVPDGELYCRCGEYVGGFSVASDRTVTAPPQPPPAESTQPQDTAAAPPAEPDAEADVNVEDFGWVTGGNWPEPEAHAAIHLPGGVQVALESGVPIELGRHAPDPVIRAALNDLDTVSRRQAVIELVEGGIRVTHVGTTNPTLVEGRPVMVPVVVPLPVTLGLGWSVHVHVTKGE